MTLENFTSNIFVNIQLLILHFLVLLLLLVLGYLPVYLSSLVQHISKANNFMSKTYFILRVASKSQS